MSDDGASAQVPSVDIAPRRRGPKRSGEAGASAPRTADAPAALLQAASDLLKERNGIEPPVLEIAERAGLNAGLIGYYFGGKDGMFVALLERNLGPSIAELEGLVNSPLPIVEKLKANITGLINLHFRYPYLNQLLLMVVERSDPERGRELSDRWVKPVCDALELLLKQGRDAGELRDIDPMLYYYTVQGACDRMFSARYSLRTVYGVDTIDRDLKQRMISHTISILLPGLEATP